MQTKTIFRKKSYKVVPIVTSTIPNKKRKSGEAHMVGYTRVSMNDQSAQRQIDDLVQAGVANVDIFTDTETGKHMDRPGWRSCVRDLQAGDILVIHSLDRLSRNLVDTMTVLQELNENGVRLKVLTLDFDSQTPMGRFVFAMMAAFAQFERETIYQRSMHGLQKARERGVIGGAAPRWSDKQILAAVKQHGTYDKAAKALECSRITIIRRMAKMNKTRKAKKAETAWANQEPLRGVGLR